MRCHLSVGNPVQHCDGHLGSHHNDAAVIHVECLKGRQSGVVDGEVRLAAIVEKRPEALWKVVG